MSKIITFKLDERIVDLLDTLAEKMKKPRSEVIREALIEYLKKKILES